MTCLRGFAILLALAVGTPGDGFAQDTPVLEERLSALMQTPPPNGFVGIQVIQTSNGATLYQQNEDRLFLPASNLKLLTAALAMERLKLDYRFTTRALREPSGNLVLLGSGDPSLSSRTFPFDKTARPAPPFQTPLRAIDDLADQIVARGVTTVTGDIIGDDRLYPWDPYPASWTIDDTQNDYGAPVSALSFNENVIAVSILPAAKAGNPALLSFSPGLEYFTIDNRAVTVARGQTNLRVQRISGGTMQGVPSQWRVSGTISLTSKGRTELLPVDDPALFAATALYEALVRRGVAIRGGPQARHRTLGERNDTYASQIGEELASRTSPPLNELLQTMLKVSQNLYAELLLREIARVAHREAITAAGGQEMSIFLAQIVKQTGGFSDSPGNSSADWRMEDGSGLSRNVLMTPRLLTRVLTWMANSPDRDVWISLLPIGGEDGTLGKRLCCMTEGRGIHAKTGSLNHVSALSGYADSKTYGLVAFSILVNDFSGPASEVRQWIDKIASTLLD